MKAQKCLFCVTNGGAIYPLKSIAKYRGIAYIHRGDKPWIFDADYIQLKHIKLIVKVKLR